MPCVLLHVHIKFTLLFHITCFSLAAKEKSIFYYKFYKIIKCRAKKPSPHILLLGVGGPDHFNCANMFWEWD